MIRASLAGLMLIGIHATSPPGLPAQQRHEFTEVHMGVAVRIVLHAPGDSVARATARAAYARIRTLDAMLSDFRPDSELRGLESHAGRWTPVSLELFDVLARALAIARATDGAFDPTIGPVVALWRAARRKGTLPDSAALAEARTHVGWRHVQLDTAQRAVRLVRSGMRLDLGGIAKGYILQAATETMRAGGVTHTLIEAGGDIVAGDAPPGRAGWRIEVAGTDSAFARRAAALSNAALATSGPTSQFVEVDGVRYSHVVDPRTGRGITSSRITYVIATDGATADAFATAAGVLGCSVSLARARMAAERGDVLCAEQREP